MQGLVFILVRFIICDIAGRFTLDGWVNVAYIVGVESKNYYLY